MGLQGREKEGRGRKRSAHGLPGKNEKPYFERTNSSYREKTFPLFGFLEIRRVSFITSASYQTAAHRSRRRPEPAAFSKKATGFGLRENLPDDFPYLGFSLSEKPL